MTVSNLNFENSYTTDGVTSDYSFTFAATDPAQVQVFLNGVQQMSGFNTALSLVTPGGTVTFTAPPTAGQTLLLYRSSDLLQNDELFDNAPLPPSTLEAMIDKLTIIAQQLQAQFNQGPIAPNGSGITNGITGAGGSAVAGFLAGLDPTGLIWELLNPVTVFQNAFPSAGAGNVVGPASSVSGNLAAFNSTNGQLLKDSLIPLADVYSTLNPPPTQILTQLRTYLVSGQPYADGSNSGNSTLYAGPLPTGNKLTVDDGSGNLSVVTLTEVSLALTLTASSAYSVFLVNTAGVQTLETDVWSNTTTPLTYGTDGAGRRCKSGATNKLLVAEIYSAVTNKVYDYVGRRHLINAYNTKSQIAFAQDTTTNWAGTGLTTVAAANANSTDGVGRVSVFVGSDPVSVKADCFANVNSGTSYSASIGIGLDSTSAYTVSSFIEGISIDTALSCSYAGILTTGVHYLQRLEASANSGVTFYYSSATYLTGGNGLSVSINR